MLLKAHEFYGGNFPMEIVREPLSQSMGIVETVLTSPGSCHNQVMVRESVSNPKT